MQCIYSQLVNTSSNKLQLNSLIELKKVNKFLPFFFFFRNSPLNSMNLSTLPYKFVKRIEFSFSNALKSLETSEASKK